MSERTRYIGLDALAARIGRPKTITAVARELAGFVWSVGQLIPDEGAAA